MGRLLESLKQRLTSAFQSAVNSWDRFWFQPQDPLALGVLRILTGSMLVYTHLVWGIKLHAFLGSDGFQDPLLVRASEPGSSAWSFWWLVPDSQLLLVHSACIVLLVLYTVGMWTAVTKWAAPIITISYANRALNANYGLDQTNAMLAIYLALGPCGARLSFDRLRQVYRQASQSLKSNETWSEPTVADSPTARLSTRMIQVHMCVVYFFAGVSKLKGEAWWNGQAVWMAFANAEYQTTDMTWTAWFPWISDLSTHATILWEMTFWNFVWKPAWRPFVLLAGVAMHIGIGMFLGMWTFGLVMIFTYVSYISPQELRAWKAALLGLLPAAPALELSVERATWAGLRWATLRKAIDFRDRVQLRFVDPALPAPGITPAVASNVTTPTRSTPQFVTMAQWWAQHKRSVGEWPFAACDRLDVQQPRIVIVHSLLETLAGLQNYFHAKGFDCRAVNSVSGACAALFERPADVLLLMGQNNREIEEILQLREILRMARNQAPASVTMVTRVPEDVVPERSPEHILVSGSATHRELRSHIYHVLQERACTDEEAEFLANAAGVRKTPSPAIPPVTVEPEIQSSDTAILRGTPPA